MDKKINSKMVVFNKEQLVNGNVDPAFIIDGVDHIDDNAADAWTALTNAGLVDGTDFAIPAGSTFVKKQAYGGAVECTIKLPNDSTLVLDLAVDLD